MKLKIVLFALIVISAFIGGYYTGNKNPKIEYIHDVKPVEYTILKPINPTDYADLLKRAETPIQIDRSLDGTQLTIVATDTYKMTKVVDSIYLSAPRNFVFAGFGVGKDLSYLYTVGYMRQIYPVGFFCGGYVSFSNASFNSVNVIVGYQF